MRRLLLTLLIILGVVILGGTMIVVVNDNMLLSARNAVLEADNKKAVKFWARQQDDKNALIIKGFNSDEANEFIAHACMDYYVYATENNK